MTNRSFATEVVGLGALLETMRPAVWGPCAIGAQGRMFDTAVFCSVPRVRMGGLGLRVLLLVASASYPTSAFGAEVAYSDAEVAFVSAVLVLGPPVLSGFLVHVALNIGFFVAAVLILGLPVIGGGLVYVALNVPRWTRNSHWGTIAMASYRWSKVPANFARADIASILVPLVDNAGLDGGTIQIVGSDGGYLTGRKKKGLTNAIKKWIDDGYKMRYILVAPSDEAILELERLESTFGDDLEVVVLRKDIKELPKEPRRIMAVLTTCHPTLIWSDDNQKQAMWIEGNHPFGEDVSYNNQWVPPAAMDKPAAALPVQTWGDVFSNWRSQVDLLCDHIKSHQ